jgi:hypothetical protein
MGDSRLERSLAAIASVVALGLLGTGVYAVFHSANGSGTAALLAIGSVALFAIAFRDRIRSMEFGGVRVQLAFKVRDSLHRAFELRIAGDYEKAEDEIEFAFNQFVHDPTIQRAYTDSTRYQEEVLKLLGKFVSDTFGGQVLETASTVSFLPLVDAVMQLDGPRAVAEIKSRRGFICSEIEKRANDDGVLRAAIIIRPGAELDTKRLVKRLDQEVRCGALGIDCFLLIQNCKKSDSSSEFHDLVINRNNRAQGIKMHAKSVAWELSSSPELLGSAFMAAILAMCSPEECRFTSAASPPELKAPAEQS